MSPQQGTDWCGVEGSHPWPDRLRHSQWRSAGAEKDRDWGVDAHSPKRPQWHLGKHFSNPILNLAKTPVGRRGTKGDISNVTEFKPGRLRHQ